jgi:hypothetical protein
MKTVIDQLREMHGELYTIDQYEFPALIDRIEFRQQVGERKYGHSIDRDDLTRAEWLQHLQEELLDAIQYAIRAGEKELATKLAQDAIDVQRKIDC